MAEAVSGGGAPEPLDGALGMTGERLFPDVAKPADANGDGKVPAGAAAPEPAEAPPPARRPEPVVPAPEAVQVLPADGGAAEPPGRSSLLLRAERGYPGRFAIALLVLGLLLGAAVAGTVVLAMHHSRKPAPFAQGAAPGSKAFTTVGPRGGWQPVCDIEFGCDRPHQIAAYVAPKYELTDGKDIVSVISGTPQIQNADGSVADIYAIIERNDRGSRIVYPGASQDNTVQYSLCGSATGCTIGGTPSIERGDELRRQALELALLTFKYDASVRSALVFFPKPATSTGTPYVLFFRRQDYDAQLGRPLADTLGSDVVVKPGTMTETQAARIGDITGPRVFKYEYRQTQQGLPILVLTPAAY